MKIFRTKLTQVPSILSLKYHVLAAVSFVILRNCYELLAFFLFCDETDKFFSCNWAMKVTISFAEWVEDVKADHNAICLQFRKPLAAERLFKSEGLTHLQCIIMT